MEQAECSKTSAFKTHTPGNYPKEIIQHSKHGECLKSRTYFHVYLMVMVIDRQELFVAVTAYVLRCMLDQVDCGWDVFLSFSNDKYKHRNEIKNQI
jgi:hypothetical protein